MSTEDASGKRAEPEDIFLQRSQHPDQAGISIISVMPFRLYRFQFGAYWQLLGRSMGKETQQASKQASNSEHLRLQKNRFYLKGIVNLISLLTLGLSGKLKRGA